MAVNIIKTFSTDLDKPIVPLKLAEPLYQQDKNGHRITVKCYHGSTQEQLDAAGGVALYFIRADHTTVVVDGEIQNGAASVLLPEACYVVPGGFRAAMRYTKSATRQTIFSCEGNVLVTTSDSIVDPSHVIPSLDELLAQIAACEAAASAATTAAAAANTAAGKLEGLTVTAQSTAQPSAAVSTVGGHYYIAFGLPKGDEPAVTGTTHQWQESTSGTTIPSGTWSDTVPTVTAGHFLWSRNTTTYDNGDSVVTYSVARFGIDGSGSVASVNGYSPDSDGNVEIPNATESAGGLMTAAQAAKVAASLTESDIGTAAHANTGTDAGNVPTLAASSLGAAVRQLAAFNSAGLLYALTGTTGAAGTPIYLSNGNLVAGTSYADAFVTDYFASDITIAATTTSTNNQITVTKSGYTPVCVCGWYVTGGLYGQVVITSLFLMNANTVRADIRNTATSSNTINLRVYVLYRKN